LNLAVFAAAAKRGVGVQPHGCGRMGTEVASRADGVHNGRAPLTSLPHLLS
jgi:hypothetical protein